MSFSAYQKLLVSYIWNCRSLQHRLCSATQLQSSAIKLSSTCVERLKEICKDGSFLRVMVEGGGCSGFQYKFDIDTKVYPEDLTFGPPDARVVVDTTSIGYIDGSTVDYHKELIRAGFRIVNNAQADHGCSCGASFSLKLDK